VRFESAFGFSDVLTRLRSELEMHGYSIMAAIDHRANAEAIGLAMPATTVLFYGNPKGGTPLMLAAPDFALELPLRLLVREGEGGRTFVVFNAAASLERKNGLPDGMAARLAQSEEIIRRAVAGPGLSTGRNHQQPHGGKRDGR
jgi:uncharacterized protein (DUF302 family)